jgi:hypothetical protein
MNIIINNNDAHFTLKKCNPNRPQYGLYVLGWKIKTWPSKPDPEIVEDYVRVVVRSWAVLSHVATSSVELGYDGIGEVTYLD